jgi:hypothetical protein
MDWIKTNSQFLLVFFSGSVFAFLLGELSKFVTRKKKWFGYSVLTRNIVSVANPDVVIKYKDEATSKLDSITVHCRNIGNEPLTNFPVEIVAGTESRIVDYELTPPKGSRSSIEQPTASSLSIIFDLLHPGEIGEVGLTLINSKDATISVYARVEGVFVKQLSSSASTKRLLLELMDSSSSILDFSKFIATLLLADRR